jgi:hypothetical protein
MAVDPRRTFRGWRMCWSSTARLRQRPSRRYREKIWVRRGAQVTVGVLGAAVFCAAFFWGRSEFVTNRGPHPFKRQAMSAGKV